MSDDSDLQKLSKLVRDNINDIEDFPHPGILFRDFSPLLANSKAFDELVSGLAVRYQGKVDAVAGLESRGFIIGAPLANRLGVSFIMVRKAGKLPPPVLSQSYSLEYGEACLEVRSDCVLPNSKVLIVDDVLATGGTVLAANQLLEAAGADVVGVCALMELKDLLGRDKLGNLPIDTILKL